jgi:ribosomal protein L11 methyltransferase
MDGNRQSVLNILDRSEVQLTPQAYIREIQTLFPISRRAAKKILQNLVHEQELSYHYLYGATYVEKNFLRPVQVCDHFILKPPGFGTSSTPGTIDIILEQGIAFGSGTHPTTQLCLSAIDFCLHEQHMVRCGPDLFCADIGTGSGVLAVAMVLSGLGSCLAYEIDPVSINEARKNIALNHLDSRIRVIDKPMKPEKNKFSMITANLRFPTLISLSAMILESLTPNGILVLSGVRAWEAKELAATYAEIGFELVRHREQKKWSALVLKQA